MTCKLFPDGEINTGEENKTENQKPKVNFRDQTEKQNKQTNTVA